jgi:predicted DNA-binding transcriptional regulator AlpA
LGVSCPKLDDHRLCLARDLCWADSPRKDAQAEKNAGQRRSRGQKRNKLMPKTDKGWSGKPLLSVEDVAILLGQSRSSIYRAIERGDLPLPVFTINGRLRIARRSVERLLAGELPLVREDRVLETGE